MEKFKLLDLFSGVGGFSLGLERSGFFETVAFCEIEKFPQRVLKKHWPEVPIYDDVRELTGERLVRDGIRVDAICGGFPCQDISVAGPGEGIGGSRSGLWKEYARIIGEIRPRYVIVENVAALLGRGMGVVLADLAALGYDAEWHCIPAGYFGAPHERDRLWIVAYATDNSRVYQSYSQKITKRLLDDPSFRKTNSWDEARPRICRMDDGIPDRVDRTSALGNSVYVKIPELIGRAIGEYELSLATPPQ